MIRPNAKNGINKDFQLLIEPGTNRDIKPKKNLFNKSEIFHNIGNEYPAAWARSVRLSIKVGIGFDWKIRLKTLKSNAV